MRIIKPTVLLCAMLFLSSAHARSLNDATNDVCEKIKTCGQEQLAQQEMPPQMRQMMEGMFDGMCQAMVAPYVVSAEQAGLERKAVACIESFESKSCQELMDGNGAETNECKELEAAVDEAYPEGVPASE